VRAIFLVTHRSAPFFLWHTGKSLDIFVRLEVEDQKLLRVAAAAWSGGPRAGFFNIFILE
jgi:hypothetical protein